MLDVAARRRAGGDTEGYGAVVDPPGRRDGGVAVRFEAAVAVGVRREDRETVADAADHPADRVAQRGRAFGIVAREDIIARCVVEIGRASGRERVWQYVSISVVAVSLKKKKKQN